MAKVDRRPDSADSKHSRSVSIPTINQDSYLLEKDFRNFRTLESAVKWKKILEKRSKNLTGWLNTVLGVIRDSGTNDQKRTMLASLVATHVEELNQINWSKVYVEQWIMHEVESIRRRVRN